MPTTDVPPATDTDRLVTRRDVARRTALSESYIRRLTDEGELPHYRFGRAVRYRTDDVDAFLEARRHAGPVD